MGRAPCCDKANVKKGPWSPEEDAKLKDYIEKYGTGGNWIALPQKAGLKRCGKSCRLRWLNYLRPNIKHGEFSDEEDRIICSLYASIGSRWSIIAGQLPGRTDNDIKNYWNTKLKKKLMASTTTTPNLNNINQKKTHHNQYNNYHQYPFLFNHYPSSLSSPSSLLPHSLSASTLNANQCTSTYYNPSLSNNFISFTEGEGCYNNNSPTAGSSLNDTLILMDNYHQQQQQQVKDNSTLLVFGGELDHQQQHHHHHHHHHHQQPSSCSSDDGSCSVITQINNNQVKQDQIIYGVHRQQHEVKHEDIQDKIISDDHDEVHHANPMEMLVNQKPSLCINGGSSSGNIVGLWGQSSQNTTTTTSLLDYGLEEIKELISTNNTNVGNNFTYYDETKAEEKETNNKVMCNYYYDHY